MKVAMLYISSFLGGGGWGILYIGERRERRELMSAAAKVARGDAGDAPEATPQDG